MSNIMHLTSINEVITCYLSGHQLSEEAEKLSAAFCLNGHLREAKKLSTALVDDTKRCQVKFVNGWPKSYDDAVADVKKAKAIARMQAEEDAAFMASLQQKRKQTDGELLWSSLR